MLKRSVQLLGFRGFPDVQGGVEVHAEQLATRLAALGWQVTALMRSPYVPASHREWRGVRIRRLWAPRNRSLEALIHSTLGVLWAGLTRPDILHIHAVGPGLVVPLARLLGLRVVFTHHGPDYDRQKWGGFARGMLKLGEKGAVRTGNATIAISRTIQTLVREKHGVEAALIPNGVVPVEQASNRETLDELGLAPRRYVLLVSRLVPEKRHLDLLDAFARAKLPGWKLVFVGAADHADPYQADLQQRAAAREGVVMAGFRTGRALQELYTHAGLFVLPSSHEGLPIAMLEALNFGLPVIASDIPANVEVGLPPDHYFPLGDVEALAARLQQLSPGFDDARRAAVRDWVRSRYSWDKIAAATAALYRNVVESRPISEGILQSGGGTLSDGKSGDILQ